METGLSVRRIAGLALLLGLSSGLAPAFVSPPAPSASAAAATSFPWPLQFAAGDDTAVIYPPELESVRDGALEGTFAVAVRAGGDTQPRFGIVHFQARVQADPGEAAVVEDFRAGQLDYPSEPERATELLSQIQAALSGVTWRTTERRLREALSVTRAQDRARGVPLRNEAPRILFSERPAVLVSVDGPPALRDVPGSTLQRVVNTRALILVEPASGRHHLRLLGNWFAADQIDGPWSLSLAVPSEAGRAKDELAQTDTVALLEPAGDSSGAESDAAPVPVVSTSAAELIVTQGPAQWGAIPDTRLLYVTNTASSVFYDLREQAYYVTLSGRWYRASALPSSEWEYVTADRLPADFARLPQGHPQEAVRASVAGTPEAREARIATAVPQTAVVQRSAAKLELAYDGSPRFEPIPGTSLEWAVNATLPVIRVSAYAYYALQNGVWFRSLSPSDGWKVADEVPSEIYAIPPSSPLHYVTYVRVYDATPTDVYVGYTPGYLGWYYGDTTVVYGTGWGYRPWIGSAWHPWPWTWGCGCCSPRWGSGFGFHYGGWWARPWPIHVPHGLPPVHRPHPHVPAFVAPVAGVGPPPVPPKTRRPLVTGPGRGDWVHVNNVYGHWGGRLPVTSTGPSAGPPPNPPQGRSGPRASTPPRPFAPGAVSPRPQIGWERASDTWRTPRESNEAWARRRTMPATGGWAPSGLPAAPAAGVPSNLTRQRRFVPPSEAPVVRGGPAPMRPPASSGWSRPSATTPGAWHPSDVSRPAPIYRAPTPAFQAAPPDVGGQSNGAPRHVPGGVRRGLVPGRR